MLHLDINGLYWLVGFAVILMLAYVFVNRLLDYIEVYIRGIGVYTLQKFWMAGFTSREYYDRSDHGAVIDLRNKGKEYVLEYFSTMFDSLRQQYVQGHKLDATISDNGDGTAKVSALFTNENNVRELVVYDVTYEHLFCITNVFPAILMSKTHCAGGEYVKI